MDSATNELFNMDRKNISLVEEISNMSPVTNLAHNLSGLRTSVAGTPIRRISWSNPIPGGDKISMNPEDLSPSVDSPTVQYAIMKSKNRDNREPSKEQGRSLSLDKNDVNKENLTPVSKAVTKPIRIEYEKNVRASTDSGYSSTSVTNKFSLSCSEEPKNFWKNYPSSPASEDDENSMETIFFESSEDQENLTVPESFNSLLTKPIQGIFKSPYKLPPSVALRRVGKLPMRRCLSKEAEFDSELGPSTSRTVGPLLNPDDNHVYMDSNANSQFKRPDPPIDLLENQSKRRRSSPNITLKSKSSSVKLQRSFSETAATIMHAILKSDMQPELVGDGTRVCALPLVKGRHDDLKTISSETMADLLKGEIKDVNFIIVDCRYPYEFEGGHIQGAENIFTKEGILEKFLSDPVDSSHQAVIIFHCEFSSERAPTLCRFLRNKDRELNEGNYPRLHHPELYILEGGYKAFFACFKELCEPQGYKPMNHKDHGTDLRLFRAKSKSWGADSKARVHMRSLSKASNV